MCLVVSVEGGTRHEAGDTVAINGELYSVDIMIQEIAECLQQNAKSEKATAFLIWKALLFSVVALTTISEHLHHRIYFTVANILQSPVSQE